MAPMTNWLTFSLSPMEMLRSSDQSHQFVSYDASSAASSSPYLLDNFYGWTNQKPQELFKEEAQIGVGGGGSMADLTTYVNPQNQIPKLEDFLGDSSSIVRYSDNSQTETQDSSLTHIYSSDPRHHHHNQNQTGFYSDHHHQQQQHQDFKTMAAGFQTAFSTNSGSEVDDSASIGRTHLTGDYLGHVVESSGPDLGFHGCNTTGGALSLAVNNNNNQISDHHYNRGGGGNNNNEESEKTKETEKEKPVVVAVETSDCTKKVADTFGQRTSIYRGVTR